MKLSSMIQEQLICFNSKATNKNECIKEILSQLKKYYREDIDYELIYEKVISREDLGTTTYENGLTIPHTRIECIDDVVISILIPAKPFIDNEIEVSMVILILSNSSNSTLYLNVLSSLFKLLPTNEDVTTYTSLDDANDFLTLLKSNDIEISREITVSDIISKDIIAISPEASIEDAINIMSKNETPFLPVCNDEGDYFGCLNFHDIISIGIPQYAQMLTSMKFISHIEPMEQLFQNESSILVKDVMNKNAITAKHDDYLVEAILLLAKEKKLFLPVLKDNKCIGVLNYNSIINNYLRV